MWKCDKTYENQFGECAYVAGAINVLTGELGSDLYKAGVHYEGLESDVFCVDGCDADVIKQCVKERLRKYIIANENEIELKKLDEEISKWVLVPSDKSMQETIVEIYKELEKGDLSQIEKLIGEYCTNVNYYLGKPKKVYRAREDFLEFFGIVSTHYLYVLFNVIFVEFESHLLMFMRGSCE